MVRPAVQRVQFEMLGDCGAKGVAGRDGWFFYRPGLQALYEEDRGGTDRRAVVAAITAFRDQLRDRGIELLVVPVPGKACMYPDRVTGRSASPHLTADAPGALLLAALERHGIATVDLYQTFRAARGDGAGASPDEPLYLSRDTHWTPAGARLAAHAVAARVRELGRAPERPWNYATRTVRVARNGDVLAMVQVPGLSDRYAPEVVECAQVLDPMAGAMVPPPGGRPGTFTNGHLIDTPLEAAILLLGDSYCRIYQYAEPASLAAGASGEKRRLLPGSAGFPSLLALALEAPVDYIVSDGGAATDVRRRLSVDPEILQAKRIVVWEFAERDILLGADGWEAVPLPPRP
jgi:hypothetical protein